MHKNNENDSKNHQSNQINKMHFFFQTSKPKNAFLSQPGNILFETNTKSRIIIMECLLIKHNKLM